MCYTGNKCCTECEETSVGRELVLHSSNFGTTHAHLNPLQYRKKDVFNQIFFFQLILYIIHISSIDSGLSCIKIH